MTNKIVDPKKKKPVNNLAESFREFSQEFFDIPKGIAGEAVAQITDRRPMSGEIRLNGDQTGAINQASNLENSTRKAEAQMRQFQQAQRIETERGNVRQKAIESQVAKLMQELQAEVIKLQQKTAELGNDVTKITVESRPTKAGIYHLNFFDMMISMLKELRQRVGESRMWLQKSMKKKQQKGYWAMFKKHGMNFAASDERAIASSNG